MKNMAKDDEHGKRLERVKSYIKARTGKRVSRGENAGHIAYRLLQQQTKDRRGTRSINQYLDDHAELMNKTIQEQSGRQQEETKHIQHPLVKRYWWRAGASATDIAQAIGDCALFAEKDDPDHWVDSFKAALKMQPLEWYAKHQPQAMPYLQAAARAELKHGR
jgi:hypothetical protein